MKYPLIPSSLTTPTSFKRTLSVKNFIILLTTQRSIQQLGLPIIGRIRPYPRFTDYINGDTRFTQLRDLTLTILDFEAPADQLHHAFRRASNLQELQLRFICPPNARGHDLPNPLPSGKASLFLLSTVTRLAFYGFDFAAYAPQLVRTSFPCLRALAVCNCTQLASFFLNTPSSNYPALIALMVKGGSGFSAFWESRFVKGLREVRELVFNTSDACLTDATMFVRHADTLNLFLLRSSDPGCEFALVESLETLLSNCRAIRHMGLFLAWGCLGGTQTVEFEEDMLARELLVSFLPST